MVKNSKSTPPDPVLSEEKHTTLDNQPTGLYRAIAESNLDKWKDRLEVGSKLGLLLVFLTYVTGFLIVSIYSSRFGVGNLGLLRPEYAMVGILWFFLIAVSYGGYLVARSLLFAIWGETSKIQRSILRLLIRLIITVVAVVMGYASPALVVSALGGGEIFTLPNLIVTGVSFFSLASLFSVKQLFREALDYVKEPHSPEDYRHHLKVMSFAEFPFRFLFLVLAITAYSNVGFPKIGQEYGGGKSRMVEFLVRRESRDALMEAGFGFQSDSYALRDQKLIFETADFFLINPPQNFEKNVSAIKIRKDVVEFTIYKSTR